MFACDYQNSLPTTDRKLGCSSPEPTVECTLSSRVCRRSRHSFQLHWIWPQVSLKLEVQKHVVEWATSLSCPTTLQWADEAIISFNFSFDISWRAKDCTLDEALWQQELNKNDHPIDPVMSRSHSVRMLHRQKLPAALIQVAQVSLCRSAVTVLKEGSENAIKMYFNGIRMIWSTYLAHGNIISNRWWDETRWRFLPPSDDWLEWLRLRHGFSYSGPPGTDGEAEKRDH